MRELFGKTKDGREVSLFTIENEHLIMKVMDYGATLVSFIDKTTGIDVVEGFDSVEGYQNQTSYIGASIGRTANRIENGTFTLNGKEYHVPINNNGNCNHGGLEGFDKKIWAAAEEADAVTFRYTSCDGEEGYPGNLFVKVTYRLLANGISIVSEGRADADTLFAYTNHSYFNLDGSENAMTHRVRIHADTYGLSDANGLTLEKTVPVAGTPFDFREYKRLDQDIEADDEQLRFGKGYDHHFPIAGEGMRIMSECEGERLRLVMKSDFPGMHLYTGNWLENKCGKYGRHYPERSGVAFEAEYCPNAVNYEGVNKKPIVREGETLRNEIVFLLESL